jgi:hypothetical protein
VRARAAAVKEPDPQEEEATLARMLASVVPPPPEAEAADVEDPEEEAEDAEAVEDLPPDALSEVEDDSPRWAERLKPPEAGPAVERSPRTSLFGSRKPVAPAGARPPERTARPTEPAMRVPAPAARPPEPSRPAVMSPEDLASPRIVSMRDRQQAGADPSDPPRPERRERARIARVVAAAPAVAVAVAPPEAVPAAEKDLLHGAITHIIARSVELAGTVDPDDRIPVDMILDHSRETIEQVIGLLGPARSSGLRRIIGDLGEIQDLIMLMQLEKGHAPADDALTLLLQIRRDLETLRAA